MLANQAMTLDAIFNNMAQRSHSQETFKGIEVLMRLALKAQAQARSTAEALALLKNPQPYIRQANMTTGPQQVNNAYTGKPLHVIRSQTREIFKVSKTNYWRQIMATTWTPERRARQAELIRTRQPWAKSTWPRSPEGRQRVSRNAWTGGHRAQLRELTKMVNEQVRASRELVNSCR